MAGLLLLWRVLLLKAGVVLEGGVVLQGGVTAEEGVSRHKRELECEHAARMAEAEAAVRRLQVNHGLLFSETSCPISCQSLVERSTQDFSSPTTKQPNVMCAALDKRQHEAFTVHCYVAAMHPQLPALMQCLQITPC